MEKSIVQEFPNLHRSVYASRTGSSFGSPSQHRHSSSERELHLKKSRIANIPDSKKQSMSENMNFVVVFQSIEIQRLAEELETLRVTVKQYERQLFNADNYEIQIKELTERCHRLESERDSYLRDLSQNQQASELIFDELDELKKKSIGFDYSLNEKYKLEKTRNQDLEMEVEKWRARYKAIDESKSSELESIKRVMEQQTKNSLSRETRELVDKFEREREESNQLMKELKKSALERETEAKKLRHAVSNGERQLEDLEKQVDDYEEKVALLSQENFRLNELSRNKQAEIAKLRAQADLLADSKATEAEQKSSECRRVEARLKRVAEELEQKKGRVAALQKGNLEAKEKLLETERVKFLLSEAREELTTKSRNLERRDRKITQLEEELKALFSGSEQAKRLHAKNDEMKRAIESMVDSLNGKSQEVKTARKEAGRAASEFAGQFDSVRRQIDERVQSILEYCQRLCDSIAEDRQSIGELEECLSLEKAKTSSTETERDRLSSEVEFLKRENERLRESHSLEVESAMEENQKLKEAILETQSAVEGQVRALQSRSEHREQLQAQEITLLREEIAEKGQRLQDLHENCDSLSGQLAEERAVIGAKDREVQTAIANLQAVNSSQQQLIARLLSKAQQGIATVGSLKTKLSSLQETVSLMACCLQQSIRPRLQKLQEHLLQNDSRMSSLYQVLFVEAHSSPAVGSKGFRTSERFSFKNQRQNSPLRGLQAVSSENFNNSNFQKSLVAETLQEKPQRLNQEQKILTDGGYSRDSGARVEFLLKYIALCVEVEALRARIGDRNARVQQMKNSLRGSNASHVSSSSRNNNLDGSSVSSTLMSNTLINRLNQFNNTAESQFESSRATEAYQRDRWAALGKRVTSQEHIQGSENFECAQRHGHHSPFGHIVESKVREVRDIKENSRAPRESSEDFPESGIYTNKRLSGLALSRGGFKSVGINKRTVS